MLRGEDTWLSSHSMCKATEALLQRCTIDTTHDVPYLGGISRGPKKPVVYIDPIVPQIFVTKRGQNLNMFRYLVVHEMVEKAMFDTFNMRYQEAHQIATRAEKAAVEADGHSWKEYQTFSLQLVDDVRRKCLEKEDLQLPDDLELRPYQHEDDDEMHAKMGLERPATWMRQIPAKALRKAAKASRGISEGTISPVLDAIGAQHEARHLESDVKVGVKAAKAAQNVEA